MAGTQRSSLRAGPLQFIQRGETAAVKLSDCGRPRSLAREIAAACASQYLARCRILGRTPALFLSGGADSACMVEAFALVAKPSSFRVCFIRFNDRLNAEEELDAEIVARSLGLPLHVHEMDVVTFLESASSQELAQRYQIRSPQLLVHTAALISAQAQRPDISPVLAWNAPNIATSAEGPQIGLPGSLYWCFVRLFSEQRNHGIPFFFASHAALLRAFLETPTAVRLLRGSTSNMQYEDKIRIYRESGFSVHLARQKRTGFEGLKRFYAEQSGQDEGEFDRRFRWPLEQLSPAPGRELTLVPQRWIGRPSLSARALMAGSE